MERQGKYVWTVRKIAARQVWLGSVDADDEAESVKKAAEEFKVAANRLIVTRQR